MIDSRKAPILAIDLGTTKSMACVRLEGEDTPTIIRPHSRVLNDWMPSVVCITKEGLLVGEDAKGKLSDPQYREDVVQCVKRYMHLEGNRFPFHNPQFRALDVSASILRHLRERAEQQLGLGKGSITEAVVTVPAYFGYTERRQTRLAARDAGFDYARVQLLDEPIAAAFGLGLHREPGERLVMVIDLGGGTLDVTLLRVGAGVGDCGFQELGRDGHAKLGGLNWDKEIARTAMFEHYPDTDLMDPYALEPDNILLYDPAEEIKIDFCTNPKSEERLLVFYDRYCNQVRESKIRRGDFFRNTQPLAERCGKICDRLLENVHPADLAFVRSKRKRWGGLLGPRRMRQIGWEDLDCVYMVGGGSQVAAVQEVIRKRWGRQPILAPKPQHQVAFGAALCAGHTFEGSPLRSPHTLGYWYYPKGRHGPRVFQPLIQRNERIDEKRDTRFRCPVAGRGAALSVELAEERLDPCDDEREVEHIELDKIRITGFSRSPAGKTEYVYLHLQCLNEREMRITAEFRGREKTVTPHEGVSFEEER
jgi:molecular chaperone DnaK